MRSRRREQTASALVRRALELGVQVAVSWAKRAVNAPHHHQTVHEIDLVARGHAVVVIDG